MPAQRNDLDAILKERKQRADAEYQRALNDPATLEEALATIRRLLEEDAGWSGVMTSRLHLEVMANTIERYSDVLLAMLESLQYMIAVASEKLEQPDDRPANSV